MDEIARFEESLEFLKDGLSNQMNAELKNIESALEELKDADERASREKQAIENNDIIGGLQSVNSALENLVYEKYHHKSQQNQLTEQMVLQRLQAGKTSAVDIIEAVSDTVEGMEEDEETQLTEEKEAYQIIKENLEEAIHEHRAIIVLKKDLKAAKNNEEFQQRLRTELEDIGFEFESVEALIQKVDQIQEESYEILVEVTEVLKDYKENVGALVSELEEIREDLEKGKRSTLPMVKRLRTISRDQNWGDAEKLAENLLQDVDSLSNYIEALIEIDQKIGRGINSIESTVESYRDDYRQEENLIR